MGTRKILNIYKPKLTKKKQVYCAPHNRKNRFSCFTKDSLLKIARAWNQNQKHQPSGKKIKIQKNMSKPKLWQEINSRLNNTCEGEWCWVKQSFVQSLSDEELDNTFRPSTPRDWYQSKKEWLSTLDIENVMKQYEYRYPEFYFIGPVPIDFDYKLSMGSCVVDELCKINLNSIIRDKIKKIGIVFNLDRHDQSGSHWVAMYIDLKKKKIYYWDSYGEPAPKEVDILAKRIQEQGKKKKMKFDYLVNKIRHQYQNSECGVYCMYFITKLLQGKSFEEVTQQKVKDHDMNMKRGYFYSPNCDN